MMTSKALARSFILCTLLIGWGLLLSGCSSSPSWVKVPKNTEVASTSTSSAPKTSMSFPTYTRGADELAPGNMVKIASPDPMINGEFRIGVKGELKLPYDVVLETSGSNSAKLTEQIRDSYKTYLRNTAELKIIIDRAEFLVDVQGLVHKPGQYTVHEDSSLDEIISKADGLSDSSNKDQVPQYVRITSQAGTELIRLADFHSGAKSVVPHWQGGETLFFQTEGRSAAGANQTNTVIHMLGQVKNPGDYAVESNADFFTYLLKAGGPNDRADPGNVSVIRIADNQTRALTFDMQAVDTIPQILPGDTIIFNADNASQAEKKSRLWANFANILSTIGVLVIAVK